MSRSHQRRLVLPFAVMTTALLVGCGASQTRPPVDDSAFVGQWFQHAGALTISANDDVDMQYQVMQDGSSATFPDLKLHITSVDSNDTTATATVSSSDDPQAGTGSTFKFAKRSPGLVVTDPQGGIHEWCDLQHKNLGECGPNHYFVKQESAK
jgi:hypothetical protein